MKQIIYTKNAPEPIGPYSQAILVNDTLYASGQIAINPQTGDFADADITAQTEQVCKNIEEILKAADMTFENVVKTTCFLAFISDFKKFNTIYEKYFISNPARSCVAAKELPKNALVEIEVIAVK
ncbi:RidA family protein [bacterium]|nr:RidA family protein [bacterium]